MWREEPVFSGTTLARQSLIQVNSIQRSGCTLVLYLGCFFCGLSALTSRSRIEFTELHVPLLRSMGLFDGLTERFIVAHELISH